LIPHALFIVFKRHLTMFLNVNPELERSNGPEDKAFLSLVFSFCPEKVLVNYQGSPGLYRLHRL
jgi:hypothetical protein